MLASIRSSLLAAAALSLSACDVSVDRSAATGPAEQPPSSAGRVLVQGASCVTLLAGQTIPVGSVCTSVSGDSAYVTYSTTNGWYLFETHLWAGTSLSAMPQNRAGNPQLGLFPYGSSYAAPVATATIAVPLSLFGLDQSMQACAAVSAYLVTHAVVKKQRVDGSWQSETAYGEGTRLVQKGNWATWFAVTFSCAADEPKVLTEETAFAWGGPLAACFIGSDLLATNRWGWTNGPLSEGDYRFDIYAGAGQCDLAKGTHVGTLSVSYHGSTATVTYAMFSGFSLSETHLYVGSDPLASTIDRRTGAKEYTVAPGQYGNIHDLDAAASDVFVVTGLSGPIHVVAHAVVASSEW